MARRSCFATGEVGVEDMVPLPSEYVALGLKHCIGSDGASYDLVEAHKWFNLAAQKGSAEARQYRSEISMDMTKQEIFKAQRMAREWLQIH